MLSDFEDAGPQALAAYQAAGLPGSIKALRADPGTLHAWTRLKSQYLVDFTTKLADRVRAIRGPQIKPARNIFAEHIGSASCRERVCQYVKISVAATHYKQN